MEVADQYDGGVLRGIMGDSRDHLGMAVLQPTLEVALGTNFFPLDGLVDGLFLEFVRHLCPRCGGKGIQPKWEGEGVGGYAKAVLG